MSGLKCFSVFLIFSLWNIGFAKGYSKIQCANFNGVWEGKCFSNQKHQKMIQFEHRITIRQEGCHHIRNSDLKFEDLTIGSWNGGTRYRWDYLGQNLTLDFLRHDPMNLLTRQKTIYQIENYKLHTKTKRDLFRQDKFLSTVTIDCYLSYKGDASSF